LCDARERYVTDAISPPSFEKQQCHISKILEMAHISRRSYTVYGEEMWVWVRGTCISKGDDTSQVANDRVSLREMWEISRILDM
jgi:hypothetical protein